MPVQDGAEEDEQIGDGCRSAAHGRANSRAGFGRCEARRSAGDRGSDGGEERMGGLISRNPVAEGGGRGGYES